MFSSAELIEALRRRMRRSIRPLPPPGEFPPGWQEWFAGQAKRPGRVSGAPVDEVIAAAAGREPLLSPDIVRALGRWRAFATLWRQDWQPASRDERWTRITAMSGTLLLHVLFVVTLIVLMFARFPLPAPEADARDGEQHVLQVEYIGEGTPVDTGGGMTEAPATAQQAPAAAAPAAAAAAPAPALPAPSPEVPRQAMQAPSEEPVPEALPPPVAEREVAIDVPRLSPPSVALPQELQVTEVDIPDTRFEVPPPRELALEAPAASLPEVPVRPREIDAPAPAAVQVPVPGAPRELEVAVPRASPRGIAVVDREIELAEATAAPATTTREVPAIRTRNAVVAAPEAPPRALPMPPARDVAGATATATATGTAAHEPASAASASRELGEGASSPATDAPPGGRPDAAAGARSAGPAPGAGRQPDRPPGALPSTRASDDWGDSTRNVPGRQAGTPGASGLFNDDGSPRLAGGGRVGGGLPPGTITEDFENIDRHGTWLKRPPFDYEPTSFDRFWVPSETLLAEWVRKSVTEVRIPIPGTTKSIRCVTVMLALGGACDILDPNLAEQPAAARKPPDVPFKRELQEAQDSLGPPPTPR